MSTRLSFIPLTLSLHPSPPPLVHLLTLPSSKSTSPTPRHSPSPPLPPLPRLRLVRPLPPPPRRRRRRRRRARTTTWALVSLTRRLAGLSGRLLFGCSKTLDKGVARFCHGWPLVHAWSWEREGEGREVVHLGENSVCTCSCSLVRICRYRCILFSV